MNVAFGFEIGENHYARQLDLEKDRLALGGLGRRCAGYLRRTTDGAFDTDAAPRLFLKMLAPGCGSAERGFVLGIFRRKSRVEDEPPPLSGVLYFLPATQAPGHWCILLLLLEPAARSRGLGSTVHAAFMQWAAARGARRLVVAVSEANGQALHFWRDRLGYAETASGLTRGDTEECRRSRDLEIHLVPAPAAPWMRLRV